VPDPVLVDVLDGGKLRAHLSDGRTVEGWRPRRNYGTHVRLSVLGLYAQSETSLTLGPDQLPVGRVFPGAFVPVQWIGKDHAVLGEMSILPNGIALYVKLSALGLARMAPPRRPESTAWLQAWGHELRFSPEASASDDAHVICAPARRLEDRIVDGVPTHRLAVYADGIEIEGWAPEDLHDSRPACERTMRKLPAYYPRILDEEGAEVVPPLEDGYVPVPPIDRSLVNRTMKWFRETRTLYVPQARGWKITCVGFKVTMTALQELKPEDPVVYRAVPYDVGWGGMELGHWETRLHDGTHMMASGWTNYQIVGVRDGSIELIAGRDTRGYHPDDTEIWYRSPKDCREHATLGHASTMF
jgi:hypothetical protein